MSLGNWLSWQRMKSRFWGRAALVFLALLVLLNFLFLHPHHPHFGTEKIPGFWAVFGLGWALVLIFVMKRIVAPIIGMDEDKYE
jgi:hypothetical protein